jgi:hypothetical protein
MAKTPKMSVKEAGKEGAQPPKARGRRPRKAAEAVPPPSSDGPETQRATDSQDAALQAADPAGAALVEQVPPRGERKATSEEIARRAYQLYEQRGRGHGSDREDWLRAERELAGDGDGADAQRR